MSLLRLQCHRVQDEDGVKMQGLHPQVQVRTKALVGKRSELAESPREMRLRRTTRANQECH